MKPLPGENVERKIEKMPMEELLQLDDLRHFRNLSSSETIFGLDMTAGDDLPPHARTYSRIMMAILGCGVKTWQHSGMHIKRAAELSSFANVTDGLEMEDKVRFVAVLRLYSRSLESKRRELKVPTDGLLVLDSAIRWVQEIYKQSGEDDAVFEACSEAHIPGFSMRSNPNKGAVEKREITAKLEVSREGILARVRRAIGV